MGNKSSKKTNQFIVPNILLSKKYVKLLVYAYIRRQIKINMHSVIDDICNLFVLFYGSNVSTIFCIQYSTDNPRQNKTNTMEYKMYDISNKKTYKFNVEKVNNDADFVRDDSTCFVEHFTPKIVDIIFSNKCKKYNINNPSALVKFITVKDPVGLRFRCLLMIYDKYNLNTRLTSINNINTINAFEYEIPGIRSEACIYSNYHSRILSVHENIDSLKINTDNEWEWEVLHNDLPNKYSCTRPSRICLIDNNTKLFRTATVASKRSSNTKCGIFDFVKNSYSSGVVLSSIITESNLLYNNWNNRIYVNSIHDRLCYYSLNKNKWNKFSRGKKSSPHSYHESAFRSVIWNNSDNMSIIYVARATFKDGVIVEYLDERENGNKWIPDFEISINMTSNPQYLITDMLHAINTV